MPNKPEIKEINIEFDKNIFYCIMNDGNQACILAKDEDEIKHAKFILSLEEAKQICKLLLNFKATIENSDEKDLINPKGEGK